eukprot:495263-Alexandrium_andersonii.AAC.1
MAPKLARPKASIVALAIFVEILYKQVAATRTLAVGAYDARKPQQSACFPELFTWLDTLNEIISVAKTGVILWEVLNKA